MRDDACHASRGCARLLRHSVMPKYTTPSRHSLSSELEPCVRSGSPQTALFSYPAKAGCETVWLGMRDSNPRSWDQNPLPYHLANPQRFLQKNLYHKCGYIKTTQYHLHSQLYSRQTQSCDHIRQFL